LKVSYDCNIEAVELAATNQIPDAMMVVFAMSKNLTPTELEIPEKANTSNKPQPTEEVQVKAIDLRISDSIKTTMIGLPSTSEQGVPQGPLRVAAN
jgi:Flp pilus assembly protein CpaB